MKKNRKYKKIKIIMVFTTVLLIAFVAVVGLLTIAHVFCMEFPELPLGGNYEPDTFKLYFADSFERIF